MNADPVIRGFEREGDHDCPTTPLSGYLKGIPNLIQKWSQMEKNLKATALGPFRNARIYVHSSFGKDS